MPKEEERERKEVETKTEAKQKQAPWWQNLSPLMKIAGVVLAFILIQGWMTNPDKGSTYIMYLGGLFILLYSLSQSSAAKLDEVILRPEEAEHLVRVDCERKRRSGQFDSMVKFDIGPIVQLQHKQARGTYYDVGVEVIHPYDRTKYFCATVIAKGIERTFVTYNKLVAPLHGREDPLERDIFPSWYHQAKKDDLFQRLIFNKL
jgi:hypothetical protein